jgi:hypothetical protein
MSKFFKVMIVLMAIAMVAGPAFAEDRLGLGGEMRVRGWYKDNSNDVATYMDQRLRIGGKFSIADGVSVTFRTDVTEKTWGAGGSEFGSGRMPQDAQQWDRAHMDLDLGNFHLRAGQQWVGYGILGGTINSQDAGLKVDMKGPVSVSAFWLLDDQRGGTATADSYLFGAQVGHKTDAYSGNVFLGGQTKAMDADESAYLIGVNAMMNLAAVKLQTELDFFFGDATATADAVGTQLLVDASMAMGDAATVGGQLLYAMSADAGEVQYENLGNDFNGYDPLFDVGTNLSNEQIGLGRPFQACGAGAGVMGGRVYGNFTASDALSFGASFAYLVPEDDNNTTVDSLMAFAGGAVYKVMSNTSLHAQLEWMDYDDTPDTDAMMNMGVGLFVNF